MGRSIIFINGFRFEADDKTIDEMISAIEDSGFEFDKNTVGWLKPKTEQKQCILVKSSNNHIKTHQKILSDQLERAGIESAEAVLLDGFIKVKVSSEEFFDTVLNLKQIRNWI
jgi:hypothetical protein